MDNQPLQSPRNLKLLRYAVAGIALIFLIQMVLYSMEVEREDKVPQQEAEDRGR